MPEVDAISLKRLEHLYQSPNAELVFKSVIAGNTRAKIWSDESARASLMWEGHGLFFAGDSRCFEFNRNLPDVLKGIAAKSDELGMSWFKIVHKESWSSIVQDLFPGAFKRGRRFFKCDSSSSAGISKPPKGYEILPIDRGVLLEGKVKNAQGVVNEIKYMWPSLEQFLEKGFGRVVCIDGAVICWCTVEYVSDIRCGIGIETAEEHRNRGIATAAASAVRAEAVCKGLIPHWDCWADNAASEKVARKTGFRVIEEYDVEVVEKPRPA